MNTRELREIATGFATVCLAELVTLGYVRPEDLTNTWYVDVAEDRLNSKRLAGGVTIDDNGLAVLYLHPISNSEYLINVIAHEVIHIAQICKGDLIPDHGAYFWQGILYESLAPEDPGYFERQPWEAEARDLEPHLVNTLRRRLEHYS